MSKQMGRPKITLDDPLINAILQEVSENGHRYNSFTDLYYNSPILKRAGSYLTVYRRLNDILIKEQGFVKRDRHTKYNRRWQYSLTPAGKKYITSTYQENKLETKGIK